MATNKTNAIPEKEHDLMAETAAAAETTAAAAEEKREKIFIPRGSDNEEPNLFVAINGVNYLLPKGKESTVPKAVADEIRRSWMAQTAAADRMAALENNSK